MNRPKRRRICGFAGAPLLFAAVALGSGRVLSYSPLSDRTGFPAVQFRSARHFLTIESDVGTSPFGDRQDRVVLYDSTGQAEPRVLLPTDGSSLAVSAAAVWEDEQEVPRILLSADADLDGNNPERYYHFLYSADAGAHWREVGLDADSFHSPPLPDFGGPVVSGRGSQIRLGNSAFPFVVALNSGFTNGVFTVAVDGSVRQITDVKAVLIGSDATRTRFLIQELAFSPPVIRTLDFGGRMEAVTSLPYEASPEGWITPDGAVYLLDSTPGAASLAYYRSIARFEVARQPNGPGATLFAVPTADDAGAWILSRGAGQPTILSSHFPGFAPVAQWSDPSGPEVEALHTGASGRRLLIQVHRTRPQADERIFRDPALAVWETGQPAPTDYNELFLNDGDFEQFVHLDVETVSSGAPFVFDSGSVSDLSGVAPSSGGGGGGDVIQEGGLVRASFQQQLVLPIVVRSPGAPGTAWRTDLVLRNPSSSPAQLTLRYVPDDGTTGIRETSLALAPEEIRMVADVLGSLFSLETGRGALFLTPGADQSVEATSRTYTQSARGQYGMEVPASETTISASARFPITYSAALLGGQFQTQLTATDLSGQGEETSLQLSPGPGGSPEISVTTPPHGQQEIPALSEAFGLTTSDPRALTFAPRNGQVLPALLAVDQTTDDPTFFGPDLSAGLTRTIPAIIHADGSNGVRWRTDVFLFNASAIAQEVTLSADDWNRLLPGKVINLTLQAGEARKIPDVLQTLFHSSGIARLRCDCSLDIRGVRLTARVYTEDAAGGTFGMRMPPLNSFQSAGPDASLEILLPLQGSGARVNLALVDLANPDPRTPSGRGRQPGPPTRSVSVEVIGPSGERVALLDAAVPQGGGAEIVDLFKENPQAAALPAVLLRISPRSGLIGAFATVTDAGTNDPAYFGAALAAK